MIAPGRRVSPGLGDRTSSTRVNRSNVLLLWSCHVVQSRMRPLQSTEPSWSSAVVDRGSARRGARTGIW
ncbi:hypothetical protein BE08_08040 [Sorangium cellulosum]|uniref:Uncharacterized protein n=1 Tax=Sorangium cellulosum TaxID=56 RepID=A0A150PED4_SORCE|nr:hypothetical protein BE08_08040 [Sorangium cellulosum]